MPGLKLSGKKVPVTIFVPLLVFGCLPWLAVLYFLPSILEERAIHESIRIHGGVETTAEMIAIKPLLRSTDQEVTYRFTAPAAAGGSSQPFTKTVKLVGTESVPPVVGNPIEIIYSQADPSLSLAKNQYRGESYDEYFLPGFGKFAAAWGFCLVPLALLGVLMNWQSLAKD